MRRDGRVQVARFIYTCVRFKRNYLALVGRWRTDVSAWVSDRHGVCPYMRPIGRVQGDADIFKSNQSYSLFLIRIKNRFVMQLRRLSRAWDS